MKKEHNFNISLKNRMAKILKFIYTVCKPEIIFITYALAAYAIR